MIFDPYKSQKINTNKVNRFILLLGVMLSFFYAFILFYWLPMGNPWLFVLLAVGEIFHLWLILTYIYTIWPKNVKRNFDIDYIPNIDIFVTVAGEPVDLVEKTLLGAKAIDYPNKTIYILNDGLVAGAKNWSEFPKLAKKLNIECITRTIPGGAKAGNINNALLHSDSDYIAIFDADHVPNTDFLKKTVGYFTDPKLAFVQSPQFYKNSGVNRVTSGASEQQELFFGPILVGKDTSNSTFMCGTNMVIARQALEQVGGMCDTNIAEDFLTSLFIHERGWNSIFVPEILAVGLAPGDFLSYSKQQFRWARGSLEVIFKFNPLFRSGLSWSQKIHYLVSASYYLSGLFVLINMIIPILFLIYGLEPINTSTMTLAFAFIPYLITALFILQKSSGYAYSFKALSFSMGSFYIFLTALISVIIKQKVGFKVTSKELIGGNRWRMVIPHFIYLAVSIFACFFGLLKDGVTAAYITNFSWVVLNNIVFVPFVLSAIPSLEWEKVVHRFSSKVLVHDKF